MLETLRTFPSTLRTLVASAPPALLRTRSRDGHFALVEQVWHLADLEVEGYGERLRRIVEEENPSLPDFRGDVVAEERRYLGLEIEPALERFASARAANVARLESLAEDQWQRRGEQEGEGRVTIARIAKMMAGHDEGSAAELHGLLR